MIPADRALRIVRGAVKPRAAEKVLLLDCAGRVLAEDLRARADNPRFDHSSMDGYAVRSRDTAGAARKPVLLRLAGRIEAGDGMPPRLRAGTAVRILTGAPMPRGADAVVMQEHTALAGDQVQVLCAVRPRESVRFAGSDVRRGAPLLSRGRLLGARETALLAGQGFRLVPVVLRPRAAVVSTGSELVADGGPLGFGRIRDANGPGLRAALLRAGALVGAPAVAGDRLPALRRTLRRALAGADLVLVSGGVSVGDKDLTRAVLEGLGVKTRFWRVSIRPGKPLYFGTRGSTAVFGLPGNPVSAWVCFEEFVRPALERMLALPEREPWPLSGRVEADFEAEGRRKHYVFCRARRAAGDWRLRLIPQDSGMTAAACRGSALTAVPLGARRVRAGERLPFRFIDL
ncbi:MAG: gephyrin-like molybdotransferase Glp [Elusimicrobiota bacterium]